ncbi:MAG: hypothetical protein R3Y54_03415 [Eubacteriales bacterium]
MPIANWESIESDRDYNYYIEGKSKRYSRHFYDIFKLQSIIEIDEELKMLVREVRNHRAKMKMYPSAKEGVDIRKLVNEFIGNHFYKDDYESITNYFVTDYVPYHEAGEALICLVDSGLFDEVAE